MAKDLSEAIERLEALALAATSGRWLVYADNPLVVTDAEGSSLGEMSAGDPYINYSEQKANAALVCAAVNTLPALLAVAKEGVFLCARLRDLEQVIEGDGAARDFHGHVMPSLARMESALAARLEAIGG